MCGENPTARVLGQKCWGVTYTAERVCALKNTSVDLSCSYKYPAGHTVIKSVWFIKENFYLEPEDVREDEEYQGRVQYTQSSQNDYLKVTVSDWYSLNKKLSCITTCTLSNKPTYIWYKNGQRVTDQDTNELDISSEDGGSFSCAVRGHEELRSPAVYSPKNTTAVFLPSGDTVEGDSVTLSCSSDANPPVLTYSWFKQSSAADTLLITDQNYSISEISSQHRGLYYCTVHNQLGHHKSTPKLLDVLCRYQSF
ncbi:B-cell receptor CD22-like [Tachysurus vachellii]|uniref:B-cell receptor CD22-like n=1 Tax=Tachysurus vachellii TaxID=175792 RepID=UPI00296A8F58|nr:B-cell receptor CD22-like [Tachysurus vachellii]